MDHSTILLFGVAIVVLYFWSTVNILKEYERGVAFRLGRLVPTAKGPGVVFIFWPIYRIVRVSLRTVTLEVPPQDIISRDNVSLKVNAIIYFRVMNAPRAVVEVETRDARFATIRRAARHRNDRRRCHGRERKPSCAKKM